MPVVHWNRTQSSMQRVESFDQIHIEQRELIGNCITNEKTLQV